jgi:UDP-N-acetyl-L-fucosamine synthase
MKVLAIVGTRPELIRLSRVLAMLDEHTELVLVHTGQNYDYELNKIFFDELGIPTPKHFMSADTSSIGAFLGDVLRESERVMLSEQPDAVLILGDTNSCIAAVMARRLRITTFHMEAGNRCWDLNVPEEANRRLVDHVSDFNLVYTEHARRNLLREGFHHRSVYVTGSPMAEVLQHYRASINASDVLERQGLKRQEYFLVSVHREENVDHPVRLERLIEGLELLAERFGLPVLVSTHPRTRKRLADIREVRSDLVQFAAPFGFFDYNKLQIEARCVISDSGTISEESSLLSFPAVTPREAIERPEALDTGAIVLTGLDPQAIIEGVSLVTTRFDQGWRPEIPADYQITNTADRVVRLMIGLTRLRPVWDGIIDPATGSRR